MSGQRLFDHHSNANVPIRPRCVFFLFRFVSFRWFLLHLFLHLASSCRDIRSPPCASSRDRHSIHLPSPPSPIASPSPPFRP